MSAIGTKQTSVFALRMSALGAKAEISRTNVHFAHLKQICSGASLAPLSPLSNAVLVLPRCCPFANQQRHLHKEQKNPFEIRRLTAQLKNSESWPSDY